MKNHLSFFSFFIKLITNYTEDFIEAMETAFDPGKKLLLFDPPIFVSLLSMESDEITGKKHSPKR